MADNTRVNDIQNKILQAMDIVNHQALSAIAYDKTILCTITNDKDREEGKYMVSDGSKTFEAYSSDTKLKAKDSVYVMIPEGKYENQKMIIGKKTSKEEKPFIYTSPFDNYFPMTVNFAASAKPGELVANDDIEYVELLEAFDVSEYNVIKYNRLGIRADIRSWVKNAKSGTYGLAVALHTEKPNTTGNGMETAAYTYFFDNTKMYGNPYSFETWYSQEIVLDLSSRDIGKVKTIDITFYQKKDFKDNQNILIPHLEKNGETKIKPNLFIQDIELSFGYDTSSFTDDFVEIFTANRYSYKRSVNVDESNDAENAKKIGVRWIHIKDEQPFNMGISSNRKNIKYEIRWYKYRIGAAAADEFSSVYWERIDGASGFEYTFNPNVNQQQERIKAIVVVFDENNNKIPYHSNELYFENEENLPPSKEAWMIENALTITTDDGTNGNYRIYRQDNSLKDSNESNKTRTLSLWFDINGDGEINQETEKVTDYDHVTWIFPTRNTMIQLLNSGNYEKIELIEYETNTYYIYNSESKTYTLSLEKFDANQTYYLPKNNKSDEYEEITNLYKPETYYLYQYNQCIVDTDSTPGTIFDNKIVYYQINENGEYEPVRNLTSEVFDYEKDNYYTLDYILDTSENFDDEKTYYYYNLESGKLTNQIPQYKIASYYSPEKNNNTIICQYELNGMLYTTEKEFTFGSAGTMGTNQTLVIDFMGDKKAVKHKDQTAEFQVQIYNEKNKLQNIPDGTVKWSWYYNSDLPKDSVIEDSTNAILKLNYRSGFKINSLYILQVEVGELKTYFSIPVKNNVTYSYIEGPTQVIYQSNGEPIYNKDKYKLFTSNDEEVAGLAWEIIKDEFQYIGTIDKKDFNKDIHFIKKDGEYAQASVWNETTGYYIERKTEEYNYIGNINIETDKKGNPIGYRLMPLSIYVEDALVYGVQAFNPKDSNENRVAYWTQPILVIQNKWPNSTINAWDGKSLQIDKETNSILAAAIAAGKKNSDNTFSGVMLGDWGNHDTESSISKQTGVYGFHHGAMSYALTEDGNAFFGKDGKGRIYIDGDKATIYSADFKNEGKGIKIDLNDPYLIIKEKTDTISTSTYPFQVGTKFKVEWNGTIHATNGEFQGTIESESGKIGGWTINSSSLSSGSVSLNSESGTISGAILQGGTLKAASGTMNLDGRLAVRSEAGASGGFLGYIEANYGDNTTDEESGDSTDNNKKSPGIGLAYGAHSVIKATATNAGLSCAGYYLSLQKVSDNPKAVLRAVDGKYGRLVLDNEHIGLGFNGSNCFIEIGSKKRWNAITYTNTIEIKADAIKFQIDAENQHGIYARFA